MYKTHKGLPAYSAEDFVVALRSYGDNYWHKHPFHLRWHSGDLDQHALQIWAANRWYYQKALPLKDAAILANCPDVAVRRRWRERIVYQDGVSDGDGGLADWLLLSRALGLTEADVLNETLVAPGVRFATDAYVTFARTRPWVEAVAASLTELFSPELMRRRVDAAQEHYNWLDPDALRYFSSRVVEAQRDSQFALELVVSQCTTRAEQDAALNALAFKCDVLWSMLDAIDAACASTAAQ